jgi:hypothetical protein
MFLLFIDGSLEDSYESFEELKQGADEYRKMYPDSSFKYIEED